MERNWIKIQMKYDMERNEMVKWVNRYLIDKAEEKKEKFRK